MSALLTILIVVSAVGNLAWSEDKLTVTTHKDWKAVWGVYWFFSALWLFFALMMFIVAIGVRF